MSVAPNATHHEQREPTVSGEIAALLVAALDEMSDAVHLFRIDDAATPIRLYQNRAAAEAPEVSVAEITEALAESGAVLRVGKHRDSVSEMRASHFGSFAGRFAVAIERDVTERDRLERAYDDAAFRAHLRADLYARLCRVAAQPWSGLDERIHAILAFALRETHMGSALLVKGTGSAVRVWKVAGDPALGIDIPESFLRAGQAPGSSMIAVPWPGSPAAACFSICCVALCAEEPVLLALGRAEAERIPAEHDAPRYAGEFLALCAMLAASGVARGAS